MRNKITTAIALSLMAIAAQAKTYSGYDYTNNNIVDINLRNSYNDRVRGEMYNYNTNSYSDVDLKPNGRGGLRGDAYDYNTGRYQQVEVDSRGNVDVYSY